MAAQSIPENPFATALRQWKSEFKNDKDKDSPFYQKLVATQSSLTTSNGQSQCTKCAKDLAGYVEQLQKTRRTESKFFNLCSKLQPFIDSVTGLMTIFGPALQAAPFEVSLAFAGAQLVLQLASKQVATFDKVVDIMTEIGRNLRCYDKISAAFEGSADLAELLSDAYKTIIGFWHRASQILSKSSVRLALTNLIKPIDAEWTICLDKLQKNAHGVLALAQATTALESREHQKADLVKKIAKWLAGNEDASKLSFRSDLAEYRSIRQDGTCNWIFEEAGFKSWSDAKKNAVAWYYAPPGSGKTILSAAVAQHLETIGRCVYFRFSFDDITRKTPLAALRSIALQLRTIVGKIPDAVEEIYYQELNHHAYQLQDSETAIRVVEAFIKQIPRVHIVIDGLDECQDLEKALTLFTRLSQAQTYGITKWFFTSRDESVIRETMTRDIKAIQISPPQGTVMKDIVLFLDLQEDKLALKKCSTCVQYWTAASEENFLYSKLMFDILCGNGVTCSDEIHDELLRFPPGLTGCYLLCLENLTHKSERERNLARRMFLFMVCAAKPLTVGELLNALAITLETDHDDYQAGRAPTLDTIRTLGGSLIRVESPEAGKAREHKIKFVHKSVLDFFKADPNQLGIATDRSDLRYFFVNEPLGHLEMGRSCLRYLQFRRYHGKVDIAAVLRNNDEHAFLKYAAAYWFEHLHDVEHSIELFSGVKSLFESRAFWTCLAVQIKVRPHLFARYTEVSREGFALGLERGEMGKDDSIMVPLPKWFELYKPEGYNIAGAFCNFVREWHEVLVSHPEAANQCQLDPTSRTVLPGLASAMSKNIRVSAINMPAQARDAALESVFFMKSKLHTRSTCADADAVKWQESAVSANNPSASGRTSLPPTSQHSTTRLIRCSQEYPGSSRDDCSLWSISLNNLSLQYFSDHEHGRVFSAPKSCLTSNKSNLGWNLVTENSAITEHGSVCALHLSTVNPAQARKEETDSGYDSASNLDSDDRSDSESEEGWSDSGIDSDADNDEASSTCDTLDMSTDCLLLCSHNEAPIHIPWSESPKDRVQISCAFHPVRKIAVFSRQLDELVVVNLSSGKTSLRTIEEPAAARAQASIRCREVRFSTDGQYLYSLMVTITGNGVTGSTCEVFLSAYHSRDDVPAGDIMQPCGEAQRLTYMFRAPAHRLRGPYVLSYWDEDMLFLCLPMLSCNPKIVRLDLATSRVSFQQSRKIAQTVTSPIYFPNSTPTRSAKILCRSSKSADKNDIFVLALDRTHLQTTEKDMSDEDNMYNTPTVYEWKIDSKDGWRDWDDALDGEEPNLSEESRKYARLRGTFIDADQRFNVVVRSGLNWTRKAFLSCA